mmetsp:Transcript_84968/g.216445  ORF Transcript_84968/g.216445 Transcript_84968/m.216445 type:complete len:245 (-) Transcript_84968:28-762(-)
MHRGLGGQLAGGFCERVPRGRRAARGQRSGRDPLCSLPGVLCRYALLRVYAGKRGHLHRGHSTVQQVLRIRRRISLRHASHGGKGAARPTRPAWALGPDHHCLRCTATPWHWPVFGKLDQPGAPEGLCCLPGRFRGQLQGHGLCNWKLGLRRLRRRAPAEVVGPVGCGLSGEAPGDALLPLRRRPRGSVRGGHRGFEGEDLCSGVRVADGPHARRRLQRNLGESKDLVPCRSTTHKVGRCVHRA